MKKFKLNSLTSIVITMAIMLSCGGYLIADDAEQPEVVEEPVIEQVEEEEPEVVEEPIEEEEVLDEEEPAEEPVEGDESFEILSVEEVISVESEYDNDYLAEQFIAQEMSVGPQVCYSSNYNYESVFTPDERVIYDSVLPQIISIAHGNRESTQIVIPEETYSYTLTAEQLGVQSITNANINELKPLIADLLPINHSLLCDAFLNSCPYELYWFNKLYDIATQIGGFRYGYSLSFIDGGSTVTVCNVTYAFSVAQEYQKTSGAQFTMNTTFGRSTEAAASNARSIIYRYQALDDYSKLLAYNNAICSLVEYNREAAESEDMPYGNPWQMIWVFDGDDSTKVVCEGYSKAFQFLCDNSVFQSSSVYSICVSGIAYFTNNHGPHMWNVVHLSDGNNYLVDVTNNDKPAPYANKLFMIGYATGSVNDGYYVRYNNYRYVYDSDTKTDYPAGVLTLSNTDYTPSSSGLTSLPAFSGHAMQLSGTIGLQFFVQLPENANPDEYYVTFTNQHGHISESEEFRLVSSDKIDSPDTYMVQINLSTIQIAERFTPTLHSTDDTWVGSAYSAQDYIIWGLANVDPASSDYRIISALADYGYYSQPYLSSVNEWTNDGSIYTQITTRVTTEYNYEAICTDTAGEAIRVTGLGGSGISEVRYAVRFGDTVSLRVFLTPTSGTAIDTVNVTGGYAGAIVEQGQSGDRYAVTISNIPATALTEDYTITYGGATITVSPMSYVYGMLNSTSATAMDYGRDLVCALYYYAQACAVNN